MLRETFVEKYSPQKIKDLPFDNQFNKILQQFIDINLIRVVLISADSFSKTCVINALIKSMTIRSQDVMFLSQFKDQGVNNIRSEVKLFSQIAKTNEGNKRILVIEDIDTYTDNIQKLFINNIDKWSQNINFLVTSSNLYSINPSLLSRLLPLPIPHIQSPIITRVIQDISKQEHIEVTTDMIDIIINLSENNLLTVFHILEKCSLLQAQTKLTIEIIKESCTIIHVELLEHYFEMLRDKNLKGGYEHLISIVKNGYSVIDILNELYLFVKITQKLTEPQKYQCFKILSHYIVNFITIHEEELELLILTSDLVKIL
jgi:replication-associated recombination protein RarA